MTEEMYRNFERFYAANTKQAIEQARQETKYESAKALLSSEVPEKVIAKALKLTPEEMQQIKKELGL